MHSNATPNYQLPLFLGTDKPEWVEDLNTAFSEIDTELKVANTNASASSQAAANAVSLADSAISIANEAEDKANSVSQAVLTAQSTADNALTNAGNAQTTATAAQTAADTANEKATAAQTTANTANENATAAQTAATEAQTLAEVAKTTAETATESISSLLTGYSFLNSTISFPSTGEVVLKEFVAEKGMYYISASCEGMANSYANVAVYRNDTRYTRQACSGTSSLPPCPAASTVIECAGGETLKVTASSTVASTSPRPFRVVMIKLR